MTQTSAAVRLEVVVDADRARAFEVFTADFGGFKPPEHNLMDVPIAETVFEPRVGGHIVDRGTDGTECRWARILAYEPPDRVVFSWDISPRCRSVRRRLPRSDVRAAAPAQRLRAAVVGLVAIAHLVVFE